MTERDADMGVGSVAHGRTYTAEEVARLASNGADLLIVDGLVVDFSAFTHPGGRSVLTRHAGEDVSDMFRGIAGTRTSSHKPMAHMGSDAHAHSAAAFSMLTRLAVGTIAASETGVEDGPFARVRARRAQLAMHTGAEGADTAVDDEGGFVDGAVDSFALGSDAVDEVWLSADHADQTAVDALRAAALDAARAAEEDADPEVRARAMGRLLAHVSLHVSMASEAGEYAMRDVVRHAIATVRER